MWEYILIPIQISTCLWMVWDDFINRQINVIAPIILFLSLLLSQLLKDAGSYQWSFLFVNAALAIIIFGFTFIYFKYLKKTKKPLETHIGIGDLIFFVALVPLGSPIYFVTVFILLTILSLIIGLVGTQVRNWENIPYAGISALGLIFFLISPYFNLTFEQRLIEKLL